MIDYRKLMREMDHQHEMLEKILENLETTQGQHANEEAVSEALNVMCDYACKHFKLEESTMEATNYPGLDQHRAEHRKFLEKTTEFCLERTLSQSLSTADVIQYLRDWFSVHLENEDRKMDLYLRETIGTTMPHGPFGETKKPNQ